VPALAHRSAAPDGPSPAGINPASTYLPELESLRGLAVLLVLAFHVDLSVMARLLVPGGSAVALPAAYVRGGYTGVGLFFVLSGFLLAGQFLGEMTGGESASRRSYLARRALRILPLYYAVVAYAATINAQRPADLLRAVPFMVFLNSFPRFDVPLPPVSAVWWSLATEVQFYLALPIVAALLRPRWRRFGVLLLIAYALAYAAFATGMAVPAGMRSQMMLCHSLFGQGPLFLLGAAAAWAYRDAGDALRSRLAASPIARASADLLLIAVAIALGVLLRWTLTLGVLRDVPPYQAWHVLEGLIWAALLLLLLLAPLHLKRVFCNRVLSELGVISYSVYLLHVSVLAAVFRTLRGARPGALVGWDWRTVGVTVGVSALCFALSWLSYRVIERPFLVRKARHAG